MDSGIEEEEVQSAEQRWYTYRVTAFVCFSSILEGYDIGVMSGALVFMERDFGLNKIQAGGLVSSFCFCMAIGAVIAGRTSARFGRRWTLFSAATLFLIGATIMTVAGSFGVLLFGRMVLGVAAGIAMLVAPMYAAELSPASTRGALLSFVEVSINVGIFCGFVSAYVFKGLGDDNAWRCMVSIGVLFAAVLFALVCFLPESPRWLVTQRRVAEAEAVLSKFFPANEIRLCIEDIQESLELERTRTDVDWISVILPCFKLDSAHLPLRSVLYLGFVVAFFQMGTGLPAVQYYTPEIIDEAHDDDASDHQMFSGLLIFGAAKLCSIFVATFTLDLFGRRKLLLVSSTGMCLALCGLAVSKSVKSDANWTGLFLICVYASFYSIGWGPVFHVLMGELFPLSVRGEAMSVCYIVSRSTSGILLLTFFPLQKNMSVAGTWWLLALSSAASFVCVYKFVPETKGLTLEQITAAISLRKRTDSDTRGDSESRPLFSP